jgi:hypothetical protein
MECSPNRNLCDSANIFAGVAAPGCSQFASPGNYQAEQFIYDAAFADLINSRGVPINYYVNTFNLLSADPLYGEEPTKIFKGPYQLQMFIELTENAINLTKFGFASDDSLTGYLHINTFSITMSALVNYNEFNQDIEPKSGDIIELAALGCDRPNGRGSKWFEITERTDQDIAVLNPLLGHYVYRVKAKRYEHSFEPGLSGERANQQVYDNSISGVLSSLIPGVSASETKSYNYDVDVDSKTNVFNMSAANNTDIYGTYY